MDTILWTESVHRILTHLEVWLQYVFYNNNFKSISSLVNEFSKNQILYFWTKNDDFESFPENELIVDEQVESDAPKTALISVFKNAH